MASRRPLSFLLTAAALAGAAGTAGAEQKVEIRIATLAPEGSSWMKVLAQSAHAIAEGTDGRVTIKYYAGGVQGDERDVIRKINLGQLDGAAVTSVGLSMVDESIRVLELPRMFASEAELDYVADRMWPYFQKKFAAKGFQLGDRGDVGWVYFMSKSEVRSVDDLKAAKLWMWGDDAMVKAMYKQIGVSGVPLGVPEVESALTTGRINACYGSPLAAVALQWNTKIRYITSLPMSYAIGATVFRKSAIEHISKDDQAAIQTLSRRYGKQLRKKIRKDNESAHKQMLKKGVKVTVTAPEMVAAFDTAAAAVWKQLETDKMFSAAELADVLKHRAEYRAKHPAPAAAAAKRPPAAAAKTPTTP